MELARLKAANSMKIKESDRINIYLNQAREPKKLWNTRVTVIPNIFGVFETVLKSLEKGLEQLEVSGKIVTIQTTVLLWSARILKRV